MKIYEKILDFARRDIKQRREEIFFREWDTKWLLAVQDYFKENNLSPDDFVVAEDLCNYSVGKINPRFKFRIESLSRILQNHSLLLERKLKWIKGKDGSAAHKTCWRIDKVRLSKILKKFEPYIESPPSPSPSAFSDWAMEEWERKLGDKI